MTKIGIISDTHAYLDERIITHLNDVDEIWHAGDIGSIEILDHLNKLNSKTRIVYGNIDDNIIRSVTKEFLCFEIEGMKVLMTHIAGKPMRYVERAKNLIEENKPDIFVCGHSHIALVQKDKHFNMLWVNPGACGNKGFHKVRTMITFEIDDKEIRNFKLIELGTRSTVNL